MTLVTVPQSNPNDEITALSVNQGPNAIATVLNGQIDDTNISALSGNKIAAGTLPASSATTDANVETRQSEINGNLIASGCIWSATTGLSGTMTSGVAYVSGKRLVVSSVASYTFTASRDTYIYIDNTGSPQYNPQTNGAAQPATPANNTLIAKVVTNGSTVTSISDLRVTSINDPWRSWTPVYTNMTVGNGTVVAKFKQIGTTVHFKYALTLGSTSSIGSGITISLPITATSDYTYAFGVGSLFDVSAGATTPAQSLWASANTFRLFYLNSGYAGVTATAPFTWTTGDIMQLEGKYEGVL